MARTPTHQLADLTLGGEGALAAHVTTERDNGRSWEAIARTLHSDHGITITGEALRQWFTPAQDPAA